MYNIKIKKIHYKRFRELSKEMMKIEKHIFESIIRYSEKEFIKYSHENTIIFIVMDNKKIVGYTMGYPERDYFYIISIGLMKKYRGMGLGRKLFRKLINAASSKGFTKFRLHTLNPAMIILSRKFGFKITHYYKNYINNRRGVLMELKI